MAWFDKPQPLQSNSTTRMKTSPKLSHCSVGLFAILLSAHACAQDAGQTAPAPAVGPALELPLPQPFPLPYAHITQAPRDDDEAAYLNYLRSSQVFPDQAVCTKEFDSP